MPGISMRAEHTEESAEVEVLFANMEKLKGLTRKIQGSLSRLDTNGRSVQDAVNPIYSNTRKLQIASSNIDRINEAINRIREPLDRKRREESIIKGGLQQTGLNDYLASLDRANQALGDLKNSNLRSNQQAMSELSGMLKHGSQQLEGAFRDILREESTVIEPLNNITKKLPFPTISQDKSSTLRQINAYTATNSPDARTLNIYAEVRGPYIANSLRNLSKACIQTMRKQDPNTTYIKGTNAITSYTEAIEGLFVAESNSICPIFAREHWARLLNETCMPAMNDFSKTLHEVHNHIKEYLVSDCFLAYEVVGVVSDLSYRLETKARASELKQPIQQALRPIRETAKYSLQRLIEDMQGSVQSIMVLPADATPSPLTTTIMTRLQNMTAYMPVLASIIVSVGDTGWLAKNGTPGSSVKSFDVGDDGRTLFSNYAADMVDGLLTNLHSKGQSLLKSRLAQGVFLCNNAAIIERMINGSELQSLLNEGARTKIRNAGSEKGVKLVTSEWIELIRYLQDVQFTNRTSGQHTSSGPSPNMSSAAFVKGLGSKEKEAAKEKFKSFNTVFDELVTRYKSLKMEREVRGKLGEEIQKLIEPMYSRFWDRYNELDKGKGKYVKYDKNQVSSILASLG